jgi:hypothetical protein
VKGIWIMNQLGETFVRHYETEWDYYNNYMPIPLNVLANNGFTTKQLVIYCRFIEQLRSILICANMDRENKEVYFALGERTASDFLAFFGELLNEHLNPKGFFQQVYTLCNEIYYWKDMYHTPKMNKDLIGTLYITFDDFRVEIERFLELYVKDPNGEISIELPEDYSNYTTEQLFNKIKDLKTNRDEYVLTQSYIKDWQKEDDRVPFKFFNQFALYAKRYARLKMLDDEIEGCTLDLEECDDEITRRKAEKKIHRKGGEQPQKGICAFPSCNAPVYLDSYCWEHYQHEHYTSK